MITARKTLRYLAGTAVLATWAVLGSVQLASAQAPAMTPEGAIITNTASVTYTDANNNPYTTETASVSVTVGFKPGIDVTEAAALVTPASPSTDNVANFTLTNTGNGTDQLVVQGLTESNPGVITNVRYVYNGTTYPDLASLNAVLSTVPVAAGASIIVGVMYDVPIGQGGLTDTITLTGQSNRDNTVMDAASTDIKPPLSGTVVVTPDGTAPEMHLPSNGTVQYTVDFVVTNNETAADVFGLVASSGANLTIVGINGTPGTTFTLPSLAAGASTTVTVTYMVNNVAAGTTDQVNLVATSTRDPLITDPGFWNVQVIRPDVASTKEAYRADQSTLISASDKVIPGESIWYKISVTNSGTAPASNVVITDPLPAELTFVSAAGDAPADWTINNGPPITATLVNPLAAGATKFIWINATVK